MVEKALVGLTACGGKAFVGLTACGGKGFGRSNCLWWKRLW